MRKQIDRFSNRLAGPWARVKYGGSPGEKKRAFFSCSVDFQLCSAQHPYGGYARAHSLHYHLSKSYTFCSVSQNHEPGKFNLMALR